MKKLMFIEILVLLALVVIALVVCMNLDQPAMAPDVPDTTAGTKAPPETTEPTTEATEPEPTWLAFPEDYSLTAQQYFVYDCDADQFVTLSGSESDRVYPASITKLVTALVAEEYVDPEALLTPGDALDLVAWGSSVAKLEKEDTLPAQKLVEGMLLPSGNDAAYVLAAAAGREILAQPEADTRYAVETFMERMNQRAKALGMTDSNFVNPDGIHSDSHYMSVRDLAILGKLALENKTIRTYAVLPRDEVKLNAGATQWKNTNMLIDPDTPFYCPYALGLKTGQTPYAGSCLLSAFQTEDRTLIIGVFGCPEIEDRFADTLHLFNTAIGAPYGEGLPEESTEVGDADSAEVGQP